jgi:hypothetical protein
MANRRRTASKCSTCSASSRPLLAVRRASRAHPGRADYRVVIGVVVARFAVIGQLAHDGAVELVQLDIDTASSW